MAGNCVHPVTNLVYVKCGNCLSDICWTCVSQWQGTWLYGETSINMKFCNMNDVLCDKWNRKLDNLRNLNTKHNKTDIQTKKLFTCMKDVRKKYKLRYLN